MYNSYMENISGFHGLLDPTLHTLKFVLSRSHFLLSVILQTAASRDADPATEVRSSEIAQALLPLIRDIIWPVVVLKNYRSVQICQAATIWGTAITNTDVTDDDPSWSLFGHARMWVLARARASLTWPHPSTHSCGARSNEADSIIKRQYRRRQNAGERCSTALAYVLSGRPEVSSAWLLKR